MPSNSRTAPMSGAPTPYRLIVKDTLFSEGNDRATRSGATSDIHEHGLLVGSTPLTKDKGYKVRHNG